MAGRGGTLLPRGDVLPPPHPEPRGQGVSYDCAENGGHSILYVYSDVYTTADDAGLGTDRDRVVGCPWRLTGLPADVLLCAVPRVAFSLDLSRGNAGQF